MNNISCPRPGPLALLLAAAFAVAACDGQGCGQQPIEDAKAAIPPVTCGPGTVLQAGQCVATEPVKTK